MSFFTHPISGFAIVGAALVGILCGRLGPYLVWKRLGLLGDAVAHASLCVVSVALLFDISSTAVLVPFSILIGYLLSIAQQRKYTELDSVLAVFFAGFMGLGLIVMSISGQGSEEILHVLFGDIQNTTEMDLALLFALNVFVFTYFYKYRKEIQLMLLETELAKIEGINVNRHSQALLIISSVTVAVCLKLMGVVLVTSLFIAPSLISLSFAKSAKQYMIISVALGLGISVGGILLSQSFATPSSATIAALGLIIFILTVLFRKRAN